MWKQVVAELCKNVRFPAEKSIVSWSVDQRIKAYSGNVNLSEEPFFFTLNMPSASKMQFFRVNLTEEFLNFLKILTRSMQGPQRYNYTNNIMINLGEEKCRLHRKSPKKNQYNKTSAGVTSSWGHLFFSGQWLDSSQRLKISCTCIFSRLLFDICNQ